MRAFIFFFFGFFLFTLVQANSGLVGEDSILDKPLNYKDIHLDIFHPRLLIKNGSKSQWSFSVHSNYQGAEILKFWEGKRPNIFDKANPKALKPTTLSNQMGVRYRVNSHSSFLLAFDWNFERPIQNVFAKTELANPILEYNRIFRLGSFENLSRFYIQHFTQDVYEEESIEQRIGLSHDTIRKIAQSRFFAGFRFQYNYYIYSGDEGKPIKWDASLYPYLEYNFSDTLALRTVFSYFNYFKHRNVDGGSLFNSSHGARYQSLGVVFYPKKDWYLFPSVEFLPRSLSFSKTNFSVVGIFNFGSWL